MQRVLSDISDVLNRICIVSNITLLELVRINNINIFLKLETSLYELKRCKLLFFKYLFTIILLLFTYLKLFVFADSYTCLRINI